MNSIEVANNPEKQSPAPAADGPVLRGFVKEGQAYVLKYETANFAHAIQESAKFHDQGKDVLVNEKDNPLIVHAKSNQSKDVDVGREVRPNEPGGVLKRGPGEIVLASFYDKLPLDTKAFDRQEKFKAELSAAMPSDPKEISKAARADAKAYAALDNPGAEISEIWTQKMQSNPVYKEILSREFPGTAKKIEEQSKPAEPAKPGNVPAEPLKVSPEPEKTAAPARAAIMTNSGYELPGHFAGTYTVKDGKFHDRESSALRFEDHGRKLSTPVEDRTVIAHMIDVAAAKNWGHLELKGTETFRQLAWLEAQSRGIETKGYKPNDKDLEQLEKLRSERASNEKHMSSPAQQVPKPVREQNEIAMATPRALSAEENMRVGVATKLMERALAKLPEDIRIDALARMVAAVEKGELKLPAPKVTERMIDRPQPAPVPAMDRAR